MRLKNVKYELVELGEGSIKELKPKLPYQLCFGLGKSEYSVDLCGRYSFNTSKSDKEAGTKFYALSRIKNVSWCGEYTQNELNILLRILKVSARNLNPRLTEILVRAVDDEIITAAFYDQVTRDKLMERIEQLIKDKSTYLPGRKLRPTQFDRQKYSVYQLLKDLVEDKAKIFIDKEYIDCYYTKISASKSLSSRDGFWGSIVSIQGNQERANLSLLVRDINTGGLLSYCVVKDGATWMTEMIIKINSRHLRSRLYGAKLIEDKFLGDKEFYLNLRNIPVIGKRYLRDATDENYLRACFNVVVQELAWKKALSMAPKHSESTAKDPGAKYVKPEGEIKSYISQGIGFYMPNHTVKARTWMNENIHDFGLEIRKKEYDEAKKKKRDMAFRYLMSKKEEWGRTVNIKDVGYLMSIKKKDIKVRYND